MTYQYEVLRTNTNNYYYGENVSHESLVHNLELLSENLANLDKIKRALFYNSEKICDAQEGNCACLPTWFDTDVQGIQAIHAILGIATEAGELIDNLLAVIRDGLPFDSVNAKEELGDLYWYQTLFIKALETCEETIKSANIKKLKSRYPKKFTEEKAMLRDLESERKILERTLDEA